MDRWMDGNIKYNRWTDGWIDRWMDGNIKYIDGQMDGQTDGWMEI